MAEGNRFQWLPSARDRGRVDNDDIGEANAEEGLVLTDTRDFHLWHKNGNSFQCKRKRSHSCSARVYFDVERDQFVTTGNHSAHPNDEQEIWDREFKNYCKVQARDTHTSYEVIHANACALYPRAIVLLPNIKKCLTQHRHIDQPRNPTSAHDAHLILRDNERLGKHKDGTDFYLGEVVWRDPGTGVNEYAQVFGNLDVLRVACEPMVNNMNGDGTFSITPFHFYQLATISTIAYGHSFAAAYFLMTRKKKELYILAINLVKQKCRELFDRAPAPTLFIGDYELALLGAAQECFPGCKSRGCWFHSSQAMYRMACDLGLKMAYTSHVIVRRIIRMGMNLPLLKHTIIPQGLEAIINYFNSVRADISNLNQIAIDQWITYIREYWIDRIGPLRFSVYRAVNRTNNFAESGHRTLNECMHGKHVNYYEFINKLKICGAQANRNLRRAADGYLISEPRKLFYKNRDRQITEKTDQLDRELTGIAVDDMQPITEFLQTAVVDSQEHYPQNYFVVADAPAANNNLFQAEFENNAEMIQAAFNALIEPPEVVVPDVPAREPRNQNDPPVPFPNPIRVVPQPGRRAGRPRLNPLPQPRAINHQPAVPLMHANRGPRRGQAWRQARRGARNAGRGRGQVAGAPLPEPAVDLDPVDEVDNLRRENENVEWEQEEPERRRQVQEHQLDVLEREEQGVPGLFDVCPICRTHEANFFISCCLRNLCEPCIRNLSIPRVVDHVAIPMNICPFCRQEGYVTAPRIPL